MSRKDYQLIAAAIKDEVEHSNIVQREVLAFVAIRLASVFVLDNSRFDRKRFLAACGFNQS